MKTQTKRLTESAMLLAVAIVLELVSKMFIPEQPFGGQITFAAMLPVILISYRHGVKWGFLASFTYALIEMVIGGKTVELFSCAEELIPIGGVGVDTKLHCANVVIDLHSEIALQLVEIGKRCRAPFGMTVEG